MRKIDELMQELNTKKSEVRGLLNDNKVEEAEAKMNEVRSLEKKIELQKQLDEQEERNVEIKMEKSATIRKENKEEIQYRAISKQLLGKEKEMTAEERASINIGDSGAILPEEFIAQVQTLTNGFPSLKRYTQVIPVSMNTGRMPLSNGSQTKKLARLKTDTALVQDMITTTPIEFAVEDFGKIYPVENQVLEDAGINVFRDLIAPAYSEDLVNTENEEILKVVQDNSVAGASGADYKAIIKTLNTKIVPSLLGGTIIVTSQTGYDYLDTIYDNNGRPLLTDSLAQPGAKVFKGRPVVVLADEDLTPETDGKVPFYITNVYALVKFFERKQIEVAASREAGFTLNQTFLRVISRFDTVKSDNRANFYVEI